MKKYELTDETIEFYGRTLHRIRACRDFVTIAGEQVEAGDLGGFVETEKNLSHNGACWVYGNAKVFGNARVYGDAEIYGNAEIQTSQDYITISPIGSRNDVTTFYKTDSGIDVKCGCFNGSIEDFLKAVEETHGDNKYGKAYRAAAELAKIQIEVNENEI